MAMESAACEFRCGGRGRPCLKAAERGDSGAVPPPDEFNFIPRMRLVGDGLRDPASLLPVLIKGLCFGRLHSDLTCSASELGENVLGVDQMRGPVLPD